MIPSDLIRRAEALAGSAEGLVKTKTPGLSLFRATRPSAKVGALYESIACLVLQGAKEARCARAALTLEAGRMVLFSHDLPVTSRIMTASARAPYLAVTLAIDFALIRSVAEEMRLDETADTDALPISFGAADPAFLDAIGRYLAAAAADPVEARVLAPTIRKEIHFRLLRDSHRAMLLRRARRDSHANRVARAIALIRADIAQPISVPELAGAVGMSASSFHAHFKAVTAYTPLQYQKELRLLEAQRLLTVEGRSVSSSAFAVGYESPTQFSREYARKYGHPPSEGARRARATA